MHGDFPEFSELYPKGPAMEVMTHSAVVEAQGYCKWTRLREIVEFAALMGYERIGLAHCPDMTAVAQAVGTALEHSGFIPILPPPSSVSDPAGQGKLLTTAGADLCVIAGMCVAHEMLFIGATEAKVVGLIARDTRLHHNPVAALYTSRSYLKSELFGHWSPKDLQPSAKKDRGVLQNLSCSAGAGPETIRSRVAEAMDVAQELGARHIGVSFCVGFREEAKELTRVLETNGFTVSSVCCKTGAIPKEEAGIGDEGKVNPGKAEMICNPVAQGELLNRDGVELAMVLGQCVGHDAATLSSLEAPAFCLVAKDRVLAHNTYAALDTLVDGADLHDTERT
jgi:uncharacterized metal-binding protein